MCNQLNKKTIIDARSYNGTEVGSDHRRTRMDMNWPKLFKTSKQQPRKPSYVTQLVEDQIIQQM